ncbi:response regulator transcription factor [Kitasatospora sp. SUK 42]|uniref:response regulator transcription factor n=1 Tax=Kitasatospora sp. SUK 42 TaxID=1588882 RepID=UPI0018CA9F27|nr:response regulator transcription factor [Kitasatospora sp. SUK 42]MBV2154917.1 response regulator transcription factor [Kitasatospora sp. SUK 42]
MVCVLVVGEHPAVAESMLHNLRRQGYEVKSAGTGREALETYHDVDLVLLDLELPDVDGLEVCRAIRAAGNTPVIAFAGRDTELDRVLALQAGSDDCIAKTCGPREVAARIEAVIRRTRSHTRSDNSRDISLRSLRIDGRARVVRLNDRVVNVTAKEFELLYILASNPESVMSRKELMAKVWESDWRESSRTLDTHVSSLRGKLGASRWIITVRGVGYRIGGA